MNHRHGHRSIVVTAPIGLQQRWLLRPPRCSIDRGCGAGELCGCSTGCGYGIGKLCACSTGRDYDAGELCGCSTTTTVTTLFAAPPAACDELCDETSANVGLAVTMAAKTTSLQHRPPVAAPRRDSAVANTDERCREWRTRGLVAPVPGTQHRAPIQPALQLLLQRALQQRLHTTAVSSQLNSSVK